ncbi:hypothetical protein [Actinomadura fibrosa]|uniref:WXG100 family type VII secretion target n=1 Tax=Actinomadura fibrosa TaxID=111802 RepID=A0ABW2Y2J3_9ACTN|nr:hypothetical protein [Actinomadura fibrosa]
MSKYHMTPEQLAKVEHTYTTGYGEYTQVETQHGLTQQEFNDLPEWQQRQYYYEYGPGVNAGHPDDPANRLPRAHEPVRGWDQKAGKGYEVNPGELRTLAKDMQYQLDIWVNNLNKVGSVAITTKDFGDAPGAENLVEVMNASKTGFNEYIGAIQTAYKGVIGKLKATADSYENAHHTTDGQVNGVKPTGGPQPDLS